MAVTKTLGPLHFEDLEPHRFEDLMRELVYDFKDWQSIEATGRSGSDEGFDIRAYESVIVPQPKAEGEDPEEGEDLPHPMGGSLWMFQCKRESEIGPSKVARIIDDGVKAEHGLYGYVLAAPVNFSKKSFDVFREELRKRGVMEFYLWGRAAIEDMLHLPKNDRVLFTFFGISLVTRRKSRRQDVSATVARKNKLIRVFGEHPSHRPVLVRDLNDTSYPDDSSDKDSDARPRWRAYRAIELHPRGLVLSVNEYFAYRDASRNEWDMTKIVDLARQDGEQERELRRANGDLRDKVEAFWHFIPRAHRVHLVRNGLIRFQDIEVIDEQGDSEFKFPHLFVEFHEGRGPFFGFGEFLRVNEQRRESLDGLNRVEYFPPIFGAPRIGTVHSNKLKVAMPAVRLMSAAHTATQSLYALDDRLDFLNVADVIGIEGTEGKLGSPGPVLIQITHKQVIEGDRFLEAVKSDPTLMHEVQLQVGRDVSAGDQLRTLEFKQIYEWAIERARSSGAPSPPGRAPGAC